MDWDLWFARSKNARENNGKNRKDLEIEVKPPAWMIYRDANRYLQRIQYIQRNHSEKVRFREGSGIISNQIQQTRAEFQWSVKKANECVNMLVRDGALSEGEDSTYSLSNWEEYRLR